MKTYLMTFKNGKQQRITVPKEWKLIFAAFALHFYEADFYQRAAFTDVRCFIEIGISTKPVPLEKEESLGKVWYKKNRGGLTNDTTKL